MGHNEKKRPKNAPAERKPDGVVRPVRWSHHGAERECLICRGFGVIDGKRCQKCDGYGAIPLPDQSIAPGADVVLCPQCGGVGALNGDGCLTCFGRGWKWREDLPGNAEHRSAERKDAPEPDRKPERIAVEPVDPQPGDRPNASDEMANRAPDVRIRYHIVEQLRALFSDETLARAAGVRLPVARLLLEGRAVPSLGLLAKIVRASGVDFWVLCDMDAYTRGGHRLPIEATSDDGVELDRSARRESEAGPPVGPVGDAIRPYRKTAVPGTVSRRGASPDDPSRFGDKPVRRETVGDVFRSRGVDLNQPAETVEDLQRFAAEATSALRDYVGSTVGDHAKRVERSSISPDDPGTIKPGDCVQVLRGAYKSAVGRVVYRSGGAFKIRCDQQANPVDLVIGENKVRKVAEPCPGCDPKKKKCVPCEEKRQEEQEYAAGDLVVFRLSGDRRIGTVRQYFDGPGKYKIEGDSGKEYIINEEAIVGLFGNGRTEG